MANTIQLKRSSTASNVPTAGELAEGELAINTNPADRKLYSKDSGGTVFEIGGIGGSIADTQIAYGSGTDIAGESGLTWNSTTNTLTILSPDSSESLSFASDNTNWTMLTTGGTLQITGGTPRFGDFANAYAQSLQIVSGTGQNQSLYMYDGSTAEGILIQHDAAADQIQFASIDASVSTDLVTIDRSTGDITSIGDVDGATIGGITSANLLDKTAAESISNDWNWQDNIIQRPEIMDYGVTHTAPTVSANAVTVNCANGNSFLIDMDPATAAVTLTLSNPPASGTYGEVNLMIVMGTPAYDITWPASVTWLFGGGAPTLTTVNNDVDVVHLFTVDGGTNWYGTYALSASQAAGDVSASGTPSADQVAVWAGAAAIEGDSNFTWDGTSLGVTGNVKIFNGTDYLQIAHDGVDVNFTHSATTDWNITGITSIQAGTVDLDVDALTATSLGLSVALAAGNGGTGQSSYTVGDILYASTASALSKLSASTSGYVLTSNGAGVAPSWQAVSASTPTVITVADESADTSCYVCYFTAATGDLGPKTGTNLTFDSSTGNLTATQFGGITSTNLLDKTAAESISAVWSWTGSGQINLDDNVELRFGTGNDVTMYFGGTNFITTGVGNWNLSGFTALSAGTVDADFDAITATSYGGITEANLLDKSATETVSGVWTFSGAKTTMNQLFINEAASADTDVTGDGQIWVKNNAPNDLYFTGDTGIDYPVAYARYRCTADTTLDGANVSETLGVQHINGVWYSDNATAYTLTLQASTVTTFPVGAQLTIWNEGSGTLTINEGTSTTLYLMDGSSVTDTAGGCTMAQGGYATLIRKSTTVYLIMGAGLTA